LKNLSEKVDPDFCFTLLIFTGKLLGRKESDGVLFNNLPDS
jgi:hypothetical protein